MEGEIIERVLNQEDQIRIQKFINNSYEQGFLKVRTKNNENFYFCPICNRCYGSWFNNGKGHFHKIHCCDELPQVRAYRSLQNRNLQTLMELLEVLLFHSIIDSLQF